MLKLTGGELTGQSVSTPTGFKSHPMSERIRIALFNVLGDISDLTVLDAFGGAGTLAFESVSRGAGMVKLFENNRTAANIIRVNMSKLGSDRISFVEGNCLTWLDSNNETYDIVLADPPFNLYKSNEISRLANFVKSGGILVLSRPTKEEEFRDPNLKLLKSKVFGNATLAFYKKIS